MEEEASVCSEMLGQKGCTLLVHNGFKYRFRHESKDGFCRWSCTKKTCPSKIYTYSFANKNIEPTRSFLEHNHEPTNTLPRQIVSNSLKMKLKEDETLRRQKPTKLIVKEISEYKKECEVTSKDIALIRRNMFQVRRSSLPKSIANVYDVLETTIRQEDFLPSKDTVCTTTPQQATTSLPASATSVRPRQNEESLIPEMEAELSQWMEDEYQCGGDLSFPTIQAKAISIFEELRLNQGTSVPAEVFVASEEWFKSFKSKYNWEDLPKDTPQFVGGTTSNLNRHIRSKHHKFAKFARVQPKDIQSDSSGSAQQALSAVEEHRPVQIKSEVIDIQDMMAPGPSTETYADIYPPRQQQQQQHRPSEWAVPQQGPPVSKPVVPQVPQMKKSLPPQSTQPSPKPAITKLAPSRPVSPPQPPAPPPEVCLRWNSYHSNMQATFPSLLNNEQFVDVTLACEGRSIKCHKMMLSACSSYFEELLSQNPCQHPIVLMKDLKFWEVQALVDFMYRGEVNVGQDKLPSLLAAAEALQIKGLAGPASTSSSHDEDSLPPTLPASSDDYLDESVSSPSSARRARKRRVMASLPTPSPQSHPQPQPQSQSTIATPPRNPVGRPRLIRPSPQPSTSSYVSSEPPLRRARRSEPSSLPLGEIKIEPIDIDLSNDSMGDSMDHDSFDLRKEFDGNGNDSRQQTGESGDRGGGGGDGGNQKITGRICDDKSTLLTGHDSEHMDFGNNNGMNMEQADTRSTDDQAPEIQGYSIAEGSSGDDPGMSSSEMNTYPEVVLNPDNNSSDSILGHH